MSRPGDLSGFRPCKSFKTSSLVKLMSVNSCFTGLFGRPTVGNAVASSFVKTLLKNSLKAFALSKFVLIVDQSPVRKSGIAPLPFSLLFT